MGLDGHPRKWHGHVCVMGFVMRAPNTRTMYQATTLNQNILIMGRIYASQMELIRTMWKSYNDNCNECIHALKY
eukprot:scaffold647801_cov34-Prasinocladus_malaysianus.AAC.2